VDQIAICMLTAEKAEIPTCSLIPACCQTQLLVHQLRMHACRLALLLVLICQHSVRCSTNHNATRISVTPVSLGAALGA
jgi:hypothetical protein